MQQRQQVGGRGRAFAFLGISLIAAIVAAALVVQLLRRANEQVEQAKAKANERVDVVVAARNLYMGLPITETDVAVRALSPEMVPADVVFQSVDMVIGRTPKERILVNEIVRSERLARREAGIGLNAIITPGKRAMSVGVKAEDAVAGFIQPLNYVDVIVVIKPEKDSEINARAVSKTLLQGMKVLAIGDTLGSATTEEPAAATPAKGKAPPPKKAAPSKTPGAVKGTRTVTLEVTPEEAEQLALAESQGDITLVLRADIDINIIQTQGESTGTLLIGFEPTQEPEPEPTGNRPMSAPKPTKPAQPAQAESTSPFMDVRQGSKSQTVTFNPDGSSTVTNQGKKK